MSQQELSSGEMAKLNCITKKALRIYREAGLITPHRIDEETGYFFYTYAQCSTIDMIQQLQSVGVSLTEIKDLVEHHSLDELTQLIKNHQLIVEQKINQLQLAQYNMGKILESCRQVKLHPITDVIKLEYFPQRYMLSFPIINKGAQFLVDEVGTYLDEWELNLRQTKQYMLDQGIPLELFHNVGCRIKQSDLEEGRLKLSSSFVLVDNEELAKRFNAEEVPAGDYLTLCRNGYSIDGARNSEIEGIREILAYVKANDYRIVGDYLGEIIADTPAFLYEGREMFYKLEVPVESVSL